MDQLFKNAFFVTTATKPKEYPEPLYPEIAVFGRSNVGKSTLLNSLFGTKDLVKTSATPGKTRNLNFFQADLKSPKAKFAALSFVDLPGVGYAKISQEEKKRFWPMIDIYMKERTSLKLVLYLFDARRDPSEEDIAFMQTLQGYDKAFFLIITKSDKIPKTQRKHRESVLLKQFPWENLTHIFHSSKEGIGNKELNYFIMDAISSEI